MTAQESSPPDQEKYFLSFHGKIRQEARLLKDGLEAAGLPIWFDEKDIQKGQRWVQRLEEGLLSCSAYIIFVDRVEITGWVRAELSFAIARNIRQPEFRILPLVREGIDPYNLSPFLQLHQAERLPDLTKQPRSFFSRLATRLREGSGPCYKPLDTCPFPGLGYYDRELSPFFFGRDAEVREAIAKLGQTPTGYVRWLQIEGNSGVGKSSFARAGLLPAVERGWLEHTMPGWKIAVCRPGTDPIVRLAEALYETLYAEDEGPKNKTKNAQKNKTKKARNIDELEKRLRGEPTALRNILLESVPKKHGFLLLIDQLEELFTLSGAGMDETPERQDSPNSSQSSPQQNLAQFEALLRECLGHQDGSFHLITTIRSDFVDQFRKMPSLEVWLNKISRYYLPPLSQDGVEDVLHAPVRLAGLEWEPELLQRIKSDLELEEDGLDERGLPLLGYTLAALWECRQGKGNKLTLADYEQIGGVTGAFKKGADSIIDNLNDEQKRTAWSLLLNLVQIGRGTQDTRRVLPRRNVIDFADGEVVLVRLSGGVAPDVPAGVLVPPRLVSVTREQEQQVVELTHEMLLRDWPRFGKQIKNHCRLLEIRDDLRAAARIWATRHKHPDALPTRGQLAYFERVESSNNPITLVLSDEEQSFLQAAKEHEQRRREAEEREIQQKREAAEHARSLAEQAEQHALAAQRRGSYVVAVIGFAIIVLIGGVWQYLAKIKENKRILEAQQKVLLRTKKTQLETYLSQARSGKLESLPLIQPIFKAFAETLDATASVEHIRIAADGIEVLFTHHPHLLSGKDLLGKHLASILRAVCTSPGPGVRLSLLKGLWFVVKNLPRENRGLLRHLKETPLLHAPLAKINQTEQAWTSLIVAVLKLLTQYKNKEIQYRTAIMLTWLTDHIPDDRIPLLLTAIEDDDYNVRHAAIEVLGKQNKLSAKAIQSLLTDLKGDNRDARRSALRVLGKFRKLPAKAIQSLLTGLKNNLLVRCIVIEVLDKQNKLPPEAIQSLLTCIKNNAPFRCTVIGVLGKFKKLPPEAIPSLLGALKDTDNNVCGAAIEVLGKFKKLPPEAIPPLLVALRDTNSDTRRAFIKAIGSLRNTSLDNKQSFLKDLDGGDGDFRGAIIKVLGKFKKLPAKAIQALLSSALKDTDSTVRAAAIELLGKLNKPPPEIIPSLLAEIKSTNWAVCLLAIDVLGKLNKLSAKATQSLLTALKDTTGDIRSAVIRVLGKFKKLPPEVIQFLHTSALKGTDWRVCHSAIEVLGKFKELPPQAPLCLLTTFKDTAGDARVAVIKALGRFKKLPPEVVQFLHTSALKGTDWRVRHAAIEVLGKFNKLPPNAIQALLTDLKDTNWYIHRSAIKVLSKFNDLPAEAINSLFAAFKDTNRSVHVTVIEVLGKFNKLPPEAIQPLITGLKSTDRSVRQSAASALRYTNQRPGIEALLRVALSDPHPKVRDAAHKSLLTVGKAPLLAQILADSKASELTRGRAADYLGFRCDPRDIDAAIRPLVTALHKTPPSEWTVRARAAHALGWLAPHLLTDTPDNKAARKTLLDLQKQAATLHPVVRTAVKVALHRIKRAQRKDPPDFLDRRRQQRCDTVHKQQKGDKSPK